MDPRLQQLAERYGVAVEYEDQRSRPVTVSEGAVRAVLEALGVDVGEPVVLPAGPRAWGWMVQLYAIPSRDSWGVGDLRDLRTLVEWTASHGGGLVLVNPLHAVAPVPPMQPSPYFPSSRRWTNPLYLRVEDLPEYATARADVRAEVEALRVSPLGDRIDRDRAWSAKSAALQVLFPSGWPVSDEVREFATWCALAERHGGDWRQWPAELRRPDTDAVARERDRLMERVSFHAWLQARCEEQLVAVQRAAERGGMPVGVVHDLAVGTDPGGADAWLLQDVLALGAQLGAPPDTFNQQGQDWGLPPWHPQRMAAVGYRPIRDLVRALLRHAGGVRIDHVLGVFRAWWVPAGDDARNGTYVRYDADAMLDAITSQARAAGAVVVGEDLGTVPPYVAGALADRGVLGTSVLWFERDDPVEDEPARFTPLARWREPAMASVTTHDLPTALGWLRGEHVRVREELGLLDDPAAERADWERDRAELIRFLRQAGLLSPDPDERDLVRALHLAVAQTPSRYVLAAPGDAVGDLRQPNLPSTTDQYPNWQLPVTDQDGRQLLLDDLLADSRVLRLAADLTHLLRPAVG